MRHSDHGFRFKSVNDAHKHEAGDQVLREFSEIMRREIRESDAAFRYKLGDEFAIVLPNTALGSARVPAERLRGRVEQYRFTIPGVNESLSLTLSAGVVALRASRDNVEDISRKSSDTEDLPSLVAERLRMRAEKTLAVAKRTKNYVATEAQLRDDKGDREGPLLEVSRELRDAENR
jgi:GGDEF domain-containing protein